MSQSKEELLKERTTRLENTIKLQPADRVPIVISFAFFAAKYAGYTPAEVIFDSQKMMGAWVKTYADFQTDAYNNPFGLHFIGPLVEVLKYKQLRIPGQDANPRHSYQFVEGEYMQASEYDDFLFDPTGFILHYYWPRIFGVLEPLKNLPHLDEILNYAMGIDNFRLLDEEKLTIAFEALLKAKKVLDVRAVLARDYSQTLTAMGFPPQTSAFSQAPFDTIADYFRGMRGVMMDMYRCPDKLLAACEKMLPIMLRLGISRAKSSGNPRVLIPIHKGLDGFMSPWQFITFFWPTLRQLILGLIAEDLVPNVFWEGDCTSRLEIIADIPKGKAIYAFERTNIFKAKEVLGDHICIRGNVPSSILCAGTPNDVIDYCRKLIDAVGKGGGFIMDAANSLDEERPENVLAMVNFTREYGVY
jgi:uroporphyrinogen-III decarboxylase